MIPNGVRIDNGNGTLCADAQAVRLGAENFADGFEAEFVETIFQIVPGDEAFLTLTALILSLITAEENVSFDILGHTQCLGRFFYGSLHIISIRSLRAMVKGFIIVTDEK